MGILLDASGVQIRYGGSQLNIFNRILSINNDHNFHKIFTICGIKFKFENKSKLIKFQIDCILNKIMNLVDTIHTIKDEIKELRIEQNTKFNRFLYKSDVEIKHLQQFLPYYEREDFIDKYISLVKGLDDNSILNINKIIVNQRKCKNCTNTPIDIFSDEEKVKIEKLRTTFNSLIIQLNENVFAYKKYLLPINWFEECVFYYKHGIPELKNLDYFKDKNIIDAGAFIGDSALILSEYTNKKVYSFEILPKHIDLINKTIELNKLNNVIPINKALGDENKKVKININTSSTSIKNFHHAEILDTSDAEMIKLDDFVKENNIEIGLIKTDLEGAEQEFLKGAENTIKTQKPTLLISIYHNPSDMFEIKSLIESWNLGYKFKIFKQPENIYLETVLIAEQ